MVPLVVIMVIRNHQVKEFFRRGDHFPVSKRYSYFLIDDKKNQKAKVGLFSTWIASTCCGVGVRVFCPGASQNP